MIVRIWHGKTKVEDYEEYSNFLIKKAVPDYKNTEGFIKLIFLRRREEDIAHFTLITFWEDIDAIKKFAGEDFEVAKYYEEDKEFLLEFEEQVVHYEVFAEEHI